jgi:hypothetical protein
LVAVLWVAVVLLVAAEVLAVEAAVVVEAVVLAGAVGVVVLAATAVVGTDANADTWAAVVSTGTSDALAPASFARWMRPIRGRKLRTLAERIPERILWYRALFFVAISSPLSFVRSPVRTGHHSNLGVESLPRVRPWRCL